MNHLFNELDLQKFELFFEDRHKGRDKAHIFRSNYPIASCYAILTLQLMTKSEQDALSILRSK